MSSSDPAGDEPAGLARVRDAADALGLSVEFRRRPPARTLAEAAAGFDIPTASIVKTLVVAKRDGSHLFALVPGDRAIAWPKLRATVGVNRLTLPDPEVALDATGYARGTIVPLGSTTAWPVYADERMCGGRIAMGAGAQGWNLFVDADPLLAALDATVTDITQEIREAPPS